MRNKIYSERRGKIHSLVNQVLKRSFIAKLMRKNPLNHDLEIDSLTGIYNQFAINNYLKELHPRSEANFGIVLLNVDNFNEIKANFNQKTANQALILIAHQLSQNIRETDLVGRYSESQFILILSDVTQNIAIHIADRLSRMINSNPLKINGQVISLQASCGVSVSEPNTISNDVLQQADQALYQAKTQRNHFHPHTGVVF